MTSWDGILGERGRSQLGRQEARVCVLSNSVVSDSLQPRGLQPTRLLCPWNSPGKNTGVGSHALFEGIFPTQGSNPVSHIAGGFFAI